MVILESTRAPFIFKANLCSQTSRLWPPLSPAFMVKLCYASHSTLCLWSAWPSLSDSFLWPLQLLNILLARHEKTPAVVGSSSSLSKAPHQQEAKPQCTAAPHKTEADNTGGTLAAAGRRCQTLKVILVPEKAQEHKVSQWKWHWYTSKVYQTTELATA